jgi:hypothetical protein
MKYDSLPSIDDKYFDFDYNVPLCDIASTTICKQGYCELEDDKILKAILYLFGMDTNRGFEKLQLPEGASIRSSITDEVQVGGYIYSGYQRKDSVWLKNGKSNTIQYLFGDNPKLLQALNKEV